MHALGIRRAHLVGLSLGGFVVIAAFKQRWLEDLVSHSGSGREALRQPLWRMIDEWQAWQPLHVEPRHLLGRSVQRHLTANRPAMPVLIVRGDLEKNSFAICDCIPQARTVIIRDCGHVCNMEQPEKFSSALSLQLRSSAMSACYSVKIKSILHEPI
jgi:pimeloyl-ACP methyl ester carboxylesterase